MKFTVEFYKRGVIVSTIGQVNAIDAYKLAIQDKMKYAKQVLDGTCHIMMWDEAKKQMESILPGQSVLVAWEDPAIEKEYVLIVKSTNNGIYLNSK